MSDRLTRLFGADAAAMDYGEAGDRRPAAGPGIGEPVQIEFVDGWFRTRDGRRAVAKRVGPGRFRVSSRATCAEQAAALRDVLALAAGPARR